MMDHHALQMGGGWNLAVSSVASSTSDICSFSHSYKCSPHQVVVGKRTEGLCPRNIIGSFRILSVSEVSRDFQSKGA